jgi:hypothetical protein
VPPGTYAWSRFARFFVVSVLGSGFLCNRLSLGFWCRLRRWLWFLPGFGCRPRHLEPARGLGYRLKQELQRFPLRLGWLVGRTVGSVGQFGKVGPGVGAVGGVEIVGGVGSVDQVAGHGYPRDDRPIERRLGRRGQRRLGFRLGFWLDLGDRLGL